MMSFETIFLVGATSGIGEELARQYHAIGKKVIISGRRIERLESIKSQLPGVESIQIDIQALDSLPATIDKAFESFPSIDAVIIVAGQQNYYNFNLAKPSPVPGKGYPETTAINSEIITNLTGPIILAREIIKQAQNEKRSAKPFTIAFVTSGLAFVPAPIFPIYCASKAALHHFIVSLRAQLEGTNIHTVEIVPPYVKTELDSHHTDVMAVAYKGKTPPGQDVREYVQAVLRGLEQVGADGVPPKVVAEGLPLKLASTWVEAFAPMAKLLGLEL